VKVIQYDGRMDCIVLSVPTVLAWREISLDTLVFLCYPRNEKQRFIRSTG
jgi:hypothetical protein